MAANVRYGHWSVLDVSGRTPQSRSSSSLGSHGAPFAFIKPSFIFQSPIEFIGHVIDFVPDITSPSEKRYPILPLHYASQASSLSTTLARTVVCLTLAKWETVSGRFGGYLIHKR